MATKPPTSLTHVYFVYVWNLTIPLFILVYHHMHHVQQWSLKRSRLYHHQNSARWLQNVHSRWIKKTSFKWGFWWIWGFPKYKGTPKSSVLMWFSLRNHPAIGDPPMTGTTMGLFFLHEIIQCSLNRSIAVKHEQYHTQIWIKIQV